MGPLTVSLNCIVACTIQLVGSVVLVIACVSPLSFSQAWRDLNPKGESRAGDASDACHMLARECPQKDNKVTVRELWC